MKRLFSYTILILITCLTSGRIVRAQEQVKEEMKPEDAIKVQASVNDESITLRWAPTTAVAWKLLNQYGYRVERYTMVRDGQVLVDKALVVLKDVYKPAGSAEWTANMVDDNVAVAAQAIFGTSFEITTRGNNMMSIVQQSQELEMRFSFALLAADVSAKASDLSALRLIDKDIQKNEKYLYRIHSLVPESILKINMGFIFVSPEEISYLPPAPRPHVRRLENAVMLSWNTDELRGKYTGYYVEKSVDGGSTYKRLNQAPIINIKSLKKDENSFSIKGDSLPDNVIVDKIFYTLRGVTAFGELSPPSEKSGIVDEEPLQENPVLIKPVVKNNKQVELNWEFSSEKEIAIAGFDIERRSKSSQEFDRINKTTLSVKDRYFVDESPHVNNYYRIVAFTKGGQYTYSFPHLVQLEDSIPPSKPLGLVGTIDSMGIVVLKWTSNQEPDIEGYRVFRSNFKGSEFGQVTNSPTSLNLFVDSVNVKTLTQSVWYKIAAIDYRYNMSEFSDMIEVLLPDIIPPVPPVIKNVKALDKGVAIDFIPSSSIDVLKHEVYRKRVESLQWTLSGTVAKDANCCSYLDSLSDSRGYLYSVAAIDDNGLRSKMTKPVFRGALQNTNHKSVTKLRSVVDRTKKQIMISWTCDEPVEKFLIYRAKGDESIFIYSSVQGALSQFVDTKIEHNVDYSYRVKAVFTDGSESVFSEMVKVKF